MGSKVKRNHYRKPLRRSGRKSTRKKTQNGEEGRRIFRGSCQENPAEEDPISYRQCCVHSISASASTTPRQVRGNLRCWNRPGMPSKKHVERDQIRRDCSRSQR